MPKNPEKNEVFNDYAAFLNALLPQAVGFLFHDRHARLFWHDNSPDTSQLDEEYHACLRKMLVHDDLPPEESTEMTNGHRESDFPLIRLIAPTTPAGV